MFFVLPSAIIFVVYLLAAVLPGIFLLRYIYRHDTIEREPAPLLASLLLMGVLAALASILLETVGIYLLSGFVSEDSAAYKIILAFLVVAVVEEGTKLFFLKRRSWRSPSFNYQFDGIVYSVFVSLGFAIFENIKYVFSGHYHTPQTNTFIKYLGVPYELSWSECDLNLGFYVLDNHKLEFHKNNNKMYFYKSFNTKDDVEEFKKQNVVEDDRNYLVIKNEKVKWN